MATIAAPFKLNNENDEDIGEFNIKFDSNKNSINKLIEFVKEYKDRRINIEFVQKVDTSVLEVISSIHDDIAVRLTGSDFMYVKELVDNHYKFFFDYHSLSAYNYTILDSLITLGVSDIYISDDLWYDLSDVSNLLNVHNIKLRAVLNRIPSTAFDKGINSRSIILRPQDYNLLSMFIDVFEFDCGKPYNWNKFSVLLDSWKDGKWVGDLREINDDLQFFFPNESIVPDYNSFKFRCGHRCMRRPNQPCRKCEQFLAIGDELFEKRIRFKQGRVSVD